MVKFNKLRVIFVSMFLDKGYNFTKVLEGLNSRIQNS